MKLLSVTATLLFSQWAMATGPRANIPCPYHRPDAELVLDEYLVVLRDGHTLQQHFEHIGRDLSTDSSMFHPITTINGYRARIPGDILHNYVRHDPGVEFVEHDHKIKPFNLTIGGQPAGEDPSGPQPGIVRGVYSRLRNLRRVDKFSWQTSKRKGDWSNVQKSAGKKIKDLTAMKQDHDWEVLDGAGQGVDLYFMDTGIHLSHNAFQGRAINFRNKKKSPCVNAIADDVMGHGTYVAGVGAGRDGMAPWATPINVKVLCGPDEEGCESTNAGIVEAISDITTDHNSNKKKGKKGWKGSVINMSFGAREDTKALRRATQKAFQAGIPIAVGAGNDNKEVSKAPCIYTESTVCVGASDMYYRKEVSSNYGPQVRMIAPGTLVRVPMGTNDRYGAQTGTSISTPFVSGAMAIYVGFENIDNDAAKVHDRLFKNSISGIITGFPSKPSTPNNFVNSGINSKKKSKSVPYNGAVVPKT